MYNINKNKKSFLIVIRFLFMKILIVFCVAIAIQSKASVYSQNMKISLNYENARLGDVLSQIEKDTEFVFFYRHDAIDQNMKVKINTDNVNIDNVLNEMFDNTEINWTIRDRLIILSKKEENAISVLQDRTVSGIVTDNGDPLPGVTVRLKGATTGTITDMNGMYSINVPNENAVLQFSFIGFTTQEIQVGARRSIEVALIEDVQTLGEIVVVAYGTSRRQDLTVAAEVVGEKQIAKTPTATLAQSLQGNTSGVMIATSGSEPGADVTIRIRGTASINAGNDPLVIIDNMPAEMSDFTALNPNDVTSITVLKDAAATAPYGSRASNGVLMITTKNGEKNKMHVSANVNYSLLRVQNIMDVMDGRQFALFENLAYFNAGAQRLPFPDLSNVPYTNFQNLLIQDGHYLQANVQLSGGTDKVTYFVSGNVVNNTGVTPNSTLSRLGIRANIKADLRPNLKFTFNSNIQRDKRQTLTNRGNDSGPFMRHAMMVPTRETQGMIFDGGWFIDPETGEQSSYETVTINTLAQQNHDRPLSLSTNGQLDWTIIPGLKANIRGGVSYRDQLAYLYVPKDVQNTFGNVQANNTARRSSATRMSWFNENFLNYNRKFNKLHDVSLTLGHSVEKTVNEGFNVQVWGFSTDAFEWNNLSSTLNYSTPSISSSSSFKSMVSAFSILSYNYNEKYYLNATYRADASSRFGDNSKWGYFPSVSAMWNVKNEDFLHQVKALSQMRLRLSWGITGNDGIGQGASMSTFSVDRALAMNNNRITGAIVNSMGNKDIKWEKTTSYNIGLDAGVLKNAIVLTFDAYYKKTTDLLYSVALPLTTGLSTQLQNVGTVENKGVEVSLKTLNISRNDFQWSTNFNISWNANKVIDLGGEDIVSGYSGASGTLNTSNIGNGGIITFLKVGEPMFVFMGYKTSVWQSWDEIYALRGSIDNYSLEGARKIVPGMQRFWGNGVTDEAGKFTPDILSTENDDRVILGHTIPDFTTGFTNTFNYKDFELSVFFVGAWGNKIFNGNNSNVFRWTNNNNSLVKSLDSYRPMNVMTGDMGYAGEYPVPAIPVGNRAPNASSNGMNTAYPARTSEMKYIEDGSYLRLKSLSLAYNLPKSICGKLGAQSLQVSLNAMNLWTLTHYSGMDPEMNSTQISSASNADQRFGIDTSASPAYKTYTVNLKFTF